jgi:threonine dehydrogenase-like Zn-dependent dehydrogenase
MEQLYFIKKGLLEWRDVAAPTINDGHQAIVRPFAVAKCDLDDIFLFNDLSFKLKVGNALGLVDKDFFRFFGRDFFKGPFPFGHECVAEVVEVGDRVKDIQVGDVVSVPFQISCGNCVNCTNGITGSCVNTPLISTYGFGKHLQFGGAMSDNLMVPYADHMLLKIPESIDPIHLASLSDNVPDAYRNVGYELKQNQDQKILVIGGSAKSIGLYTVLIAKAMHATRVDYVDYDGDRLALAKKAGADHVFESFAAIKGQYDIVVEASSTEKGLLTAIKHVRPYGIVSCSGIFIKKARAPLVEMYAKGVVFRTGLANARTDAINVLELIKKGKLNLSLLTTRLDSWKNAIDALLSKTSKVIVVRERLLLMH